MTSIRMPGVQRLDMQKTYRGLQHAVLRIVNGGPKRVAKDSKLTISNVAKEAGVDRSTIYKYHPAILNEIHSRKNATPMVRLKDKNTELGRALDQVRQYRKTAEEARADIERFAQVNYRLNHRIKELEALLAQRDKVIKGLQTKLDVQQQAKLVPLKGAKNRK
jgi:ACT domain-containing protein